MQFHKHILLLLAGFVSLISYGQENFDDLSAKERVKIAEKEEKEAKRDDVFQNMMREGHELFREKHYLKAIHKYEEAKQRRPYNVYPPVIITDIELSMKDTLEILRKNEQQEKLSASSETPQEVVPEEEQKPERNWSETKEERIDKIDDWERNERKKREAQRQQARELEQEDELSDESENPELKVISVSEMQKELAEEYPEGVTENSYEEGNKKVVERIVVSGDIGNRYKMVSHNWGGVFYFKNGNAVTERVWKSETQK